jgi:hypothetical protein
VRTFSSHRVTPLLTLACGIACACTVPAAAQDGWTTHRDPSGYIVDVPPGWVLRYDALHHKVMLDGKDGARVVLRMVTAAQALDPDQGADVGQALAKDADPAVRWKEAEIVSDTISLVPSSEGTRYGKAFFTWNSTPKLSVGYLYAETGPHAVLTADRPAIKRIWTSYRIALPPAARAGAGDAAAPQLRYARFTEPVERMFTVDLPAAWARSGGIYRQSPLDIRPAFRAEIAGSAAIQSGDPAVPFFSVPTAASNMAGFPVGKWLPYPGMRLLVAPYADGPTFARQYAASHFGPICSGLQIADARPRPDASAQLNATYAQYGLPAEVSAGEVAFTCTADGTQMRGYVFAGTEIVRQPTNAIWYVPFLLSYVAKNELAAQAQAALQHAVATYQIDPVWARTNADTAKNISDITTRTGEQMFKITSDTFWNRAASEARTSAVRSNATRGVQTAVDPLTKTPMTIDNRYEYNWIDPSGHIVGSDVSASPGAQFRRLITGP